MDHAAKRIVVAFRLAGEPRRRKLNGFFRYMAEHRLDWQLQFVRIREDFNADFVRSFPERGIDGVAYSLPDAKDGAAELARLDIPTVALDILDEETLCGRKKTSSSSPTRATTSDARQRGTSSRRGSTARMPLSRISPATPGAD